MVPSSPDAPAFLHLAAHPLRWRLLTVLAAGDYRVRELVSLVGEPQNLVSYHLRLLRDSGLVIASRSSFDGRDSYYHLDLDHCARALAGIGTALHPALHREAALPPVDPRRSPRLDVLFVCTGNSARSPIAEALLGHRAGGQVRVLSAGTRPKPRLHPHAVRVLRDSFGIDVTGQQPRHLDTVTGRRYDYVITLCDKAREVCPDFAGEPVRMHWSLADPSTTGDPGEPDYSAFQRAATDIDTRIRHLLPLLTAIRPAKETAP
ncbi:ArsR family transcriptional regulator [Micromonospora echinaurantiaca]|uniref:arsenate reductase/protein-tyrosine-phosphatase family protein n=1 Tax=Micromonospora echinaurantiaca TaxID=47857 RepID=UPI00378EB57C